MLIANLLPVSIKEKKNEYIHTLYDGKNIHRVQTINAIVQGPSLHFLRTPFLWPDIGEFTISHCGRAGKRLPHNNRARTVAKIEILLSPKAALQLKCIFTVYELNLINNFCIVAECFILKHICFDF